jgi:hypothetical protein
MTRQGLMIGAGAVIILAIAMVGCRGVAPPVTQTVTVSSSWPALTVPADVQRIAVFYPQSSNRDFSEAYHRLEGAVFQLKAYRSKLQFVDRFNLPTVITELRFQNGGAVTDDSALHMGHMLGVDSVLLYAIDGPTLTDRVMARRLSQVRPLTITTKIIRVESAEVVYLDVVIAKMDDKGYGDRWLYDNMDYQQLSREALERSIKRTVIDLQRAFQ